jgi:hypothetical protein
MVTWESVIKKYGKRMANKIGRSKYMYGITLSYNDKGEVDIPEGDINRAIRDIKGKKIHPLEWD